MLASSRPNRACGYDVYVINNSSVCYPNRKCYLLSINLSIHLSSQMLSFSFSVCLLVVFYPFHCVPPLPCPVSALDFVLKDFLGGSFMAPLVIRVFNKLCKSNALYAQILGN